MNIYFIYDVIRLYSISYTYQLRDDVEKVIVLGGMHHKVGGPSLPQVVVDNYHFIVEVFCLESPDMKK